MTKKILITRPLFPDVVDRLRAYFDVTVNEGPRYTAAQLHEALRGMSGAVIRCRGAEPGGDHRYEFAGTCG
jgi:hypothetical protein